MQGKAVLANHPIHPMLVALPIGLFVGAAVSDIISIWGDPAFWPVMSVWLIAFGVVGALLAAIFGFIDYFTAPMGATTKKTATTHMVLNLLVVALYIAAFFVRLHAPVSTLGYILSFVGLGILVVSGWFGGALSYVGLVGTVAEHEAAIEGREASSRTLINR